MMALALNSNGGGYGMFRIESPDFSDNGPIPERYTCEGENLSPFLRWDGAPPGTRSYVLTVEDPDAPMGTFMHWVLFDLPSALRQIERGASRGRVNGAKQGMTDFGQASYGGPCPPKGHGRHRYQFVLRALDVESLGLAEGARRNEIESAVKGHVLAETRVTGIYQR